MKSKTGAGIKITGILKDSLIKNSIFLIMTSFFNATLGFFFWIIVSRYYVPKDIGTISAVLSASALISMISLIGLPTSLIFYLPKLKEGNRIINSSIMTSIVTSIIFSLIFILGSKIWTPELAPVMDSNMSTIFVFMTIITSVSGIMTGIFISGRKSSYTIYKDNVTNIIKIPFLIIFVGFGIIGFFISLSIGYTISIIIAFFLLYKTWRYIPTLTFDPIIKNMAKYSLENYIAGIFAILPRLILPIMIINSLTKEDTGYFYIAMTTAYLLYGIPISISNSLLAESSEKDKFENNIEKAIKFNISLLIPGLLLFTIFGRFVLGIFNHSYAENAADTLKILSIASIPISMINIFNTVKNAQNRVMSTVIMNFIVSLSTIALAIPLMKTYGIEGAAISFLMANMIGAIIVIKRVDNPIKYVSKLIKYYRDILPINYTINNK